ncbi:MAG: cation:proton antiporter [Ornithinibacter sp.]
MDDASAILVGALAGGMLASAVRLPPLVGFLAAGFALSAVGVTPSPGLDLAAGLGVTILLFGVGLKIDLRSLLQREVWLTASVHMVLTSVVAGSFVGLLALVGVGLAAGGDLTSWLLVGFALSFSSTVFVVKVLEDRGWSRSLVGRTAIGVLVVQDLAAVLFLALAEGRTPSPWAILLLLVIPAAWPLRRMLASIGHGELLPLLGVVLALVPGYALFEAVGVKGDVGALVIGMLLAGQPRADELAKSLFELKDLLLVAFFVSIGLAGLPTVTELAIACALLVLLPLKAFGFAVLLWTARLRRRTSVLAGTALANYSEFGLIVVVAAPASMLDEGWTTVVATAVAGSFVAASLPGRHPEYLTRVVRRVLPDRPTDQLHPQDRPLEVGTAQAVVLGMGRVGTAAYERLSGAHGLEVLGLETSRERVDSLTGRGLRVVEGDATNPELWADLPFCDVSLVLLAMPFHGNNLDALGQLRANGFAGTIAVAAQYDDDLAQAVDHGAQTGIQIYDGAGSELADRAVALLRDLDRE